MFRKLGFVVLALITYGRIDVDDARAEMFRAGHAAGLSAGEEVYYPKGVEDGARGMLEKKSEQLKEIISTVELAIGESAVRGYECGRLVGYVKAVTDSVASAQRTGSFQFYPPNANREDLARDCRQVDNWVERGQAPLKRLNEALIPAAAR